MIVPDYQIFLSFNFVTRDKQISRDNFSSKLSPFFCSMRVSFTDLYSKLGIL